MWIFDSGMYETIKRSAKKIQFRLKGGKMAGEYIIYNIKEDQWLMERKDAVVSDQGLFIADACYSRK